MKAFHRTYVITHHTLWYSLVRWSVGLLNCFLTTTKHPPEFVFNRAETTSFRRSRTECFGTDPSAIAVFTYAQMNRAKGGNAPGSCKVKVFSFYLIRSVSCSSFAFSLDRQIACRWKLVISRLAKTRCECVCFCWEPAGSITDFESVAVLWSSLKMCWHNSLCKHVNECYFPCSSPSLIHRGGADRSHCKVWLHGSDSSRAVLQKRCIPFVVSSCIWGLVGGSTQRGWRPHTSPVYSSTRLVSI